MGAAKALIWWCCCIILAVLPRSCSAIYCDEDNCYHLLGVSETANSSEIKKSYYKLSLKYHPDKNPDPESRKIFVKVANAYEILKDEATREQYDYALAHPEEVFYNAARYYHAYYGHKTDPRAVLVGLLLVLSAFQYLNQWTRYTQAISFKNLAQTLFDAVFSRDLYAELAELFVRKPVGVGNKTIKIALAISMVKKTPAYKNKLRALELERSGGVANKRKGHKQINKTTEEDLGKELELQINGAEKPSIWGLVAVRLLLLPYTLSKLSLWHMCWFWRYRVKKASFSWNDASYLTQRSLRVPLEAWKNTDDLKKEDLVRRRLWESSNMEDYMAELRKDMKRRR